MPALNVTSLLMGVISLCNIWLLAILGSAELCPVLDMWMPPDSWEAEAVSRHVVDHQCFDEGALGHGCLLGETGAAVQQFRMNHWLTLVFHHYVIKVTVGFGVVFYPRLEHCQSQPHQFHSAWEEKQKPCSFSLDLNQTLTWAWKVWLFDGSPPYVPLTVGRGSILMCCWMRLQILALLFD